MLNIKEVIPVMTLAESIPFRNKEDLDSYNNNDIIS